MLVEATVLWDQNGKSAVIMVIHTCSHGVLYSIGLLHKYYTNTIQILYKYYSHPDSKLPRKYFTVLCQIFEELNFRGLVF